VRVEGRVSTARVCQLAQGCVIDHIRYAPAQARLEQQKGRYAWIVITLTEGKNREVRILMNAIGLKVRRLIRVGFGPFRLASLAQGELAPVRREALERLQKQWL